MSSIGWSGWRWSSCNLLGVLVFLLLVISGIQSVELLEKSAELKPDINNHQPDPEPQISQNDTICEPCQCKTDSRFITVICDFNQNNKVIIFVNQFCKALIMLILLLLFFRGFVVGNQLTFVWCWLLGGVSLSV